MLTLSGELRQADYTDRRQDAITFCRVLFSHSARGTLRASLLVRL